MTNKNQQIVGAQQRGQVQKLPVVQLAVVIQMQQAAACALRRGGLGDSVGWKIVVELGEFQRGIHGKENSGKRGF